MKRMPAAKRAESSDEFEGSFFGNRFKVSGKETIYIAIIVLALASSGYMLLNLINGVTKALTEQGVILSTTSQSISISGARIDEQHKVFSDEHHVGTEVQKQIVEALREQNYIITRTEAQRKKLNLEMPDSLRKKTRPIED